ncbi:SDR family oxidoreductase [Actinokineospora soli]|uniref:SDR family oxidoreductase n=1 Tax=Actinokineospora soli TaxID=1048753 RepID=A0ABW2TL23_9PSEU
MTVFISGATGLVGRLLLDALPGPVRALTRRPDRRDLPEHVEVVGEVDLRGVTAVFVHPRAVADLDGLVRAARAAGVGKVVALSAANVDEPLDAQPSRFRGDRNKEAEDAVVGSGLPWVSLRAASFASNTATAWAAQLARGTSCAGLTRTSPSPCCTSATSPRSPPWRSPPTRSTTGGSPSPGRTCSPTASRSG